MILKHLKDSPEPSPLLKRKVKQGELGFKTRRGLQEWPPEEAEKIKKATSVISSGGDKEVICLS